MVTLTSSDDASFTLPLNSILGSETVRNLVEDAGIENPIPLPNVTGKILAKVVEYCNYHAEHPTPEFEDKKKDENRTDDIIPWDLDFCKVEQSMLFDLILAANYLDIRSLLDLTCKTVANMIKGKTPSEIRATFGIEKEFTDEEREQVRKENEWVEEL